MRINTQQIKPKKRQKIVLYIFQRSEGVRKTIHRLCIPVSCKYVDVLTAREGLSASKKTSSIWSYRQAGRNTDTKTHICHSRYLKPNGNPWFRLEHVLLLQKSCDPGRIHTRCIWRVSTKPPEGLCKGF